MMKISIIVPVYNCEKYLSQCIDSLLSQSYPAIEIILVNDGATDASPSICRQYELRDRRIKVIDKQNGGVSSARNAGLKMVSGEYVLFVDSDDWIDSDACMKIAEQLDDRHLIYFWNLVKNTDHEETKPETVQAWTSLTECMADVIACPRYQNAYIRACWAKVYKRELLEKLSFPEDLYIGEDACFLLDCLSFLHDASQIRVVNDSWYHYRILQESAVHRYKPDLYHQTTVQYHHICDIVRKLGAETEPAILTAMTMFCWESFFDLNANAIKSGAKSADCKTWAKLTKMHLKRNKAETHKMRKLVHLSWLLHRALNADCIAAIGRVYEHI